MMKSISRWLAPLIVAFLVTACGGSNQTASQPTVVRNQPPTVEHKDVEPKTDPVQPAVTPDEKPAEETKSENQDHQEDGGQTKNEDSSKRSDDKQESADHSKEQESSDDKQTASAESDILFGNVNQDIVNVTSNASGTSVVIEDETPGAAQAEFKEPQSVPEDRRFKLADRQVGYAFISTDKDSLGKDDLNLQDDELYVRCTVSGYKPMHMLVTQEYMKELAKRDNIRATTLGFVWTQTQEVEKDGVKTQTSLELECVAYRK